ncbi:hypothetical protein Tco_0529492 [Tanacetum coccineum]
MPWTSSDQLADNLHDVMMETLPSLVKEKVTEQVKKEVPAQVRDQVLVYLVEGLILERKMTKEETERLISLHQQLHSQELKNMMCFLLSMSPYMESFTLIARKRKG